MTLKKKVEKRTSSAKAEKGVKKSDRSYGTASLVLGILSLLLPIIGFGLAILAIVFYGLQRKIGPSGLATAGMTLGVISLALHLLLIIALVVIVIVVLSALPTIVA